MKDTNALHRISYGLFVCTAAENEKINGCIINTAMQVTSSPERITIAVNKENYTHDMIMRTGKCNISVISQKADFELFKRFGFCSGRDTDKFADFPGTSFSMASNGIPYITEGTNAYLSLKVTDSCDVGTHTLFICELTESQVLSDVPSCTYEYYHASIKPKPQPVGKTREGKTIWVCSVCGYEWEGDELPDDFECPVCKHPKADFEKYVL